ncbi:hypothetical protein [Acidisarcina polymorpha]|uniref:hypothetical protein n=1 Tax=Acidisarcina polymorpha TaxID=2211140 RepID=UPI000DEF8655|nr:hypothetical protein [Acidisarcina polymorpha]
MCRWVRVRAIAAQDPTLSEALHPALPYIGAEVGCGSKFAPVGKVKGSEDEHLENSTDQHHGGAADGVMEAVRKEARDDDEDSALLADPTCGRADIEEQGIVDGGKDEKEDNETSRFCADTAGQRSQGDAEGERTHAEESRSKGSCKMAKPTVKAAPAAMAPAPGMT